jgi:hypothetical protein
MKNEATLKRRHIIMITSEEVQKIKGDERFTYEDMLSIISEIKMNRVSTLAGGY